MNDTENLSRLLGHLKPERFRAFMTDEFGLLLPELEKKKTKTGHREAMAAVLTALPVAERQKIEEVAEKIVLLTDGPGQDVVDGFRGDIFDDAERAAFDALPDQYERALWLHVNAPAIFKEALDARQADVFRQSVTCYSGFVAPKNLAMTTDASARAAFHERVARHLGCAKDHVAIQIFTRLRPNSQTGEDVDLYQVSIHNNRPPEIVDCVQASQLVGQEVVRAVASHITYEPANGNLYDYQSLAAPRSFDLAGENVASVKVAELGYTDSNHRSLLVKLLDLIDLFEHSLTPGRYRGAVRSRRPRLGPRPQHRDATRDIGRMARMRWLCRFHSGTLRRRAYPRRVPRSGR